MRFRVCGTTHGVKYKTLQPQKNGPKFNNNSRLLLALTTPNPLISMITCTHSVLTIATTAKL